VILGLPADLPGDLGDPVFICWAIARSAEHWLALFTGDLDAPVRFWHGEHFYPEPLTTAYSEHFAAHALQILPVWAATRNAILCHNLLFLSTYVLSGLGMYLLVRDLTGRPAAAFIAGLAFVCAPYRVPSAVHLQVLSSQWMPFTFLGIRRYLAEGSRGWLAAGAAAWLLQNLSSGYYLIYFGPFAAAYAVTEVWARGLLRNWRIWRDLVAAGALALAATLPFALPSLVLKIRAGFRRPLPEIASYSPDLLDWLNADPSLVVWGWLHWRVAPEVMVFPGVAIVMLALLGLFRALRRPRPGALADDPTSRAVALFAALGVLVVVWLALGPTPRLAGSPAPIPSLYRPLYDVVPGFDASRVPARMAMIAAMLLAMLAGYGIAGFAGPRTRWLWAPALAVVLDGLAVPVATNRVFWTSPQVSQPEQRIHRDADAPGIWRYLRTLPPDAVLAHLPFGYAEYELLYQYYGRLDGHRFVNGYSGAFPLSWVERTKVLQQPLAAPDAAAKRLRADGVTHVVVHADAWPDDTGARVADWLERAGAMRLARIDNAIVYVLAP
jgi:hypothetical protein